MILKKIVLGSRYGIKKTSNLVFFTATTTPQKIGPVQLGSGHQQGSGKANNQRIKECAWKSRPKSVIFIDPNKRHSQKVLHYQDKKEDKDTIINLYSVWMWQIGEVCEVWSRK